MLEGVCDGLLLPDPEDVAVMVAVLEADNVNETVLDFVEESVTVGLVVGAIVFERVKIILEESELDRESDCDILWEYELETEYVEDRLLDTLFVKVSLWVIVGVCDKEYVGDRLGVNDRVDEPVTVLLWLCDGV